MTAEKCIFDCFEKDLLPPGWCVWCCLLFYTESQGLVWTLACINLSSKCIAYVYDCICSMSLQLETKFRLNIMHAVAAHLRAAIGLRAAFGKFLLHQNSSLCTVTFGEKVLTLAKSRGS